MNPLETSLKRHAIILSAVMCAIFASCGDPAQNTTLGHETSSAPAPATENAPSREQKPSIAGDIAADEQLPEYELVYADDGDQGYNPAIKINAVVSGQITESGLRRLLLKLLAGASSSTGRPRVFIYLFQSHEHFESGMGQWIAMLKPGSGPQPDIDVKTELVEQLGTETEVIGGLPEVTRKKIFWEIVLAEDRADTEALLQYPFVTRRKPAYSEGERNELLANQSRARKMLVAKYMTELTERYGVTETQLEGIQNEGSQRDWPLPDG